MVMGCSFCATLARAGRGAAKRSDWRLLRFSRARLEGWVRTRERQVTDSAIEWPREYNDSEDYGTDAWLSCAAAVQGFTAAPGAVPALKIADPVRGPMADGDCRFSITAWMGFVLLRGQSGAVRCGFSGARGDKGSTR
ncbi:hypothetical protein CALCODRAFT_203050 [Calocera cornea HHB12733]|uniref:Uncharacterized protein n=1 Tax=Calocera cornea HHB12733 TaxID=1353952 RepID=A0A165JYB8_9BASI|nr:hypothetical protein CALCODRAFT_203050 [Calocera cornea HHB12733]